MLYSRKIRHRICCNHCDYCE